MLGNSGIGSGIRALMAGSRRQICVLVVVTLLTLVGGVPVASNADSRPAALTNAPSADPTDTRDVEAFLDELLVRRMEQQHIVGATVAVIADGRPVFAKGYGYADRDAKSPVIADRTLFYIGSAGKLFTWTAVMQQVEQGRLDLHTDINTYLDFTVPSSFSTPITMAHLMTHTAGFEEQLAALMAEPQDVLPLRDFLIQYVPHRRYSPGTTFAYSNYGTALAGYIVERVSGEPFEQYLTAHLLEPLGMHQSAAVQPLPARLAADFSKGYAWRNGTYDAFDLELAAVAPAAAIRATATDMTAFMLAHLHDGQAGRDKPSVVAPILRLDTLAEMHRPQFTPDPRLPGMAYGFIRSRENDRDILWHDGASARFTTLLALVPEERAGLFISTNTPGLDERAILSAFLDRYHPATQPDSLASTTPDPDVGRFAGTFVSTRSAHTSAQKLVSRLSAIEVQPSADGTLLVGSERWLMIGPGLYRQADGERLLAFREDAGGNVTHLFRGPVTYFRVPWYEVPSFLLLGFILCLATLLSALLSWPFEALIRRRRHAMPRASGSHVARWIAATLGLSNLLLVAAWVTLMLRFADTYIYPSGDVTLLIRLATVTVMPLTAGVAFMAVRVWTCHTWGLAWRLHYALLTLGSVGLVGWLAYWNLLGVGP